MTKYFLLKLQEYRKSRLGDSRELEHYIHVPVPVCLLELAQQSARLSVSDVDLSFLIAPRIEP